MQHENINRLKEIVATTNSVEKRTWALWMLLTNHIGLLTTAELFDYIPLIWQTHSEGRFFGIRQKIEAGIKARQNKHTIEHILELLKNDNPHLRYVAADLLNAFNDEMIIDPLLNYLRTSTDDHWTRRQGICALGHYKDARIRQFLVDEYARNKDNQDELFRANFLWTIEVMLGEY